MAETKRMTKLVRGYLKEIRPTEAVDAPLFCVVKVGIAAVHGEVSVCQSAARSVERIPVAVFTFLESDLNVNLKTTPIENSRYCFSLD